MDSTNIILSLSSVTLAAASRRIGSLELLWPVLIGAGIVLLVAALAGAVIETVRKRGWRGLKAQLDVMFDYGYHSDRQHGIDFDPDKVKIDVDYSALPQAEEVSEQRFDLWRDDIATILATDVGSTTTKALLWERTEGESFRLVARTEAPTTVEHPWEDVTLGLRSAIEKIEQLTGRRILADGAVVSPPVDGTGVDLFFSTSSAGGGLQMTVAGVMRKMTAESADRAASAAGGIVTDVMSLDDGRLVIDRVQRLRQLRPDIILLSGGTDGSNPSHVVNLAEQIAAAAPRTRLGGIKTPLVYAGDATARAHVMRLLDGLASVHIVDNLRPILERENIEPARTMIHKLFMEHVMSQAPGYAKLLAWAKNALLPTPGAVGRAVEAFGDKYGINAAAFDIGGATTDVFTRYNGRFDRTVSANLGMSYSATNVLAEAGPANVLRWLPFSLSEAEVEDWAANKMIRPTSLPDSLSDLLIEQALAREALRLSLRRHQRTVSRLSGVSQNNDGRNIFTRSITVDSEKPTIDLQQIDVMIGSGGVLSHAPRRAQALLMMLDALQPEGFTELFVDTVFMSPQLGLLSTIRPQVAAEILERDCLQLLGACIAPVGRAAGIGRRLAHVVVDGGGEHHEVKVIAGRIGRLPLRPDIPYRVKIYPASGYDCGSGPGRPAEAVTEAGLFGLILDGRGRRPLRLPADPRQRIELVRSWMSALGAFSDAELSEVATVRKGA
ncbi:MAG: glutamate mutase L [Chloroflexota bacterium]